MPGPRTVLVSCVVAATIATSAPNHAGERYSRDGSDHPGMPRQIYDLDHDDRGFLWLASEGGIHRGPNGRLIVRSRILRR